MKAAIEILLLLAKLFGKIVGSAARTQTRLLTEAQTLGWKPSEHQAQRLIRRQHQLFQFEMTKKQMKLLKKTNPKMLDEVLKEEGKYNG